MLVGLAGLAVLLASQGVALARQRRLTGDLQRSQSSFRTLVKSSVDPVVILDDELRVTFASQSVADLLGVDPACIVGRPIVVRRPPRRPPHPLRRASAARRRRAPTSPSAPPASGTPTAAGG